MGFEDDYGIDEGSTDSSESSPPTDNSGGSSSSSEPNYSNSDRFVLAYYKPKKDFDASNSAKIGSAFNCELTQYDTYNSVFISMAKQIKEQTQERGAKIFDWANKDSLIKFKCGIVDVQQILTVLTYSEPEVGLFHKAQGGVSTTLSATTMGSINNDKIKSLSKLFENGDDKNPPRKTGINPRSINLMIKRGDVEFKIMLLPHEVIGLRVFFEEALKRMYGKPYVKKQS